MDEPHLLSGGYAADALDDAERREFEAHLESCPQCREEARGLRETTAVLAAALATAPPPAMRSRVLDAIATTPQLPAQPAGPTVLAEARARKHPDRRRRWAPLAAACVVLLAGIGLGAVGAIQLREAHRSQQLADRVLAILGDPRAQRVTAPVSGGGSATLVVADARAAVVTAGLPGLPDDRAYQLWVIRPEQIRSAGLGPGGTAGAGSWARLLDGVRSGDKVAITVEPAGGSGQPTTAPITALQA
jgi:anti-sigma-K factor RskA